MSKKSISESKNRILIIIAFFVLLVFMFFNIARIGAYAIKEATEYNNDIIENLTEGIYNRTSVSIEEIKSEKSAPRRLKKIVLRYTEIFESICTALFPWSESVDEAVGKIDKAVFYSNIVFDQGYYGNLEVADECAENLKDFANYLDAENVDYMYIQTPGLQSIKNIYNSSESNHVLSFKQAFFDQVKKKGIEIYNLLDVWNLQRGFSSFDLVKHWNPADGLYASQLVIEKINQEYGFGVSDVLADDKAYTDLFEEYPDFQKKVYESVSDGVTYPVPVKSGNYRITITKDSVVSVTEGDWCTCFIHDYDNWDAGGMYYKINSVGHGGITEIENLDLEEGPTCIIIGDSFVWPMYGYMSQSFKKITEVWSHEAKDLDLKNIIREEKPDIVLIIQNDAQFQDDYFRFKLIDN